MDSIPGGQWDAGYFTTQIGHHWGCGEKRILTKVQLSVEVITAEDKL